MQPVNDDINNLFRRAAENYPLNTQGAGFDFDKVRQQLDADNNVPLQKQHKRRYLLWLLLFPFSFIMEHHFNGAKEEQQTAYQNKIIKQQTAENGNRIVLSETPVSKTITITDGTQTSSEAKEQDEIKGADQLTAIPEKSLPDYNHYNQNSTEDYQVAENKTKSSFNNKKAKLNKNETIFSSSKKSLVEKRNDGKNELVFQQHTAGTKDVASVFTSKQNDKLSEAEKEILESGFSVKGDKNSSIFSTKDSLQNTITTTGDTVNAALSKEDSKKDSLEKNVVVKKTPDKNSKQKGFAYIGAVVGTDWSVVKSNRTSGMGYNAGFTAGYQFNKHWAVQTGAVWNMKKYYSDGKYVSVDNLGLRTHTEIIYIDGSCGMIEIPLTVQYHFTSKKQHNWYVSTGLSSYLMKNEEYYYLYTRYNQLYYGEKEYKNSSKNWLSVLQLSAGYQLKIKGLGSFRAEPYLKLPVGKIGIAKLPLSSAGLNIGYTLPLK